LKGERQWGKPPVDEEALKVLGGEVELPEQPERPHVVVSLKGQGFAVLKYRKWKQIRSDGVSNARKRECLARYTLRTKDEPSFATAI
jgi:hypothetical protein